MSSSLGLLDGNDMRSGRSGNAGRAGTDTDWFDVISCHEHAKLRCAADSLLTRIQRTITDQSESRDKLLAAVDVVRRAGDCRVAHDVDGQRRDVSRPDDAPNGQRRTELVTPSVEVVAEDRCRKGRVDEACGNQVNADWRELEREIGDEGGERDGDCRDDSGARSWTASTCAPHEYQGARWPDLAGGPTCDREREQQVLGEAASHLLNRHFEERPVVGSAGGDHHVVDRCWDILEE